MQFWLSALGHNDNYLFPKLVGICSKHFSASDFYFKDDGYNFLNRDAMPTVVHLPFHTPSSRTSKFVCEY
nr:unnamed protein product [Callosobruchus analis]